MTDDGRGRGSRPGRWDLANVASPGTGGDATGPLAFVAGGLAVLAGLAGLLASTVADPGTAAFWLLRSGGAGAAALGLAALLYGTVAMLPLGVAASRTALVGLVVCATGVGLFWLWYPGDWGRADYGRFAVSVYAVGLAIQVATVVVFPARTPDTDADSDDEPTDGADDPGTSVTFELYERDGWRWRLVSHEGGAVAASSRRYDSEAAAREAAAAVAEAAPDAGVAVRDVPPTGETPDADGDGEESTGEGTDDADDEPGVPEPVGGRSGASSFELYEADAGWRWRLRHPSGTVLAESGERFEAMDAAEAAVDGVRRHAPGAGTLEFSPGGFEVYECRDDAPTAAADGPGGVGDDAEDRAGRDTGDDGDAGPTRAIEWLWRLRHRSGEVIAVPPGPFDSREAAMAGIQSVKAAVDGQPAVRETDDGWRWRLGHEGEAVAVGVEEYATERRATGAFERVRECVRGASAIELDPVGFEVQGSGDEWAWCLRHRDGSVLARRDGYASRERAVEGVRAVMEAATDADVTVRTGDTARIIDEALAQAEKARSAVESLSDDSTATVRDDDGGDGVTTENGDSATPDEGDPTDVDGVEEGGGDGVDGDDEASHEDGVDHDGKEIEGGEPASESDGEGDGASDGDAGRSGERSSPSLGAGETVFEVYETDDGWAFRFCRGEYVVATASGLPDRASAIDGVERVSAVIGDAPVVAVDPVAFQVYGADDWRWRLVTDGGTVLAESDGGFESPGRAREAVEEALAGLDGGVQLYEDDGWRWRLRHDRRIVAVSAGGYDSTDAAKAAVDRIREAAPDAPVVECAPAAIELHPADGEWGWRLRDADGSVLAGAGGYDDPGDAERALADVRRAAPDAPMRFVDDPDEG